MAGNRLEDLQERSPDLLSLCCEAFTTYMEVGTDDKGETVWALCCKACYGIIE
jgi:hypothetical protein